MRDKMLLYILASFFLFVSCDSNSIFDEYKSVPNKWHKDSIISFKVNPPDSTEAYNLFINLRNNSDYRYSNLFLIVETNFPNGKGTKDTLEYIMTKANGEFLGTGFSDLKENKLWFKEGVVFDESGEYSVNIQHAMRKNGSIKGLESLEGITDIGFRIEKMTSKE